jgi:hypothetical protein
VCDFRRDFQREGNPVKFSIRDLLWLIALAAVLTAWWLDHRAQIAAIEELKSPTWNVTTPVAKPAPRPKR